MSPLMRTPRTTTSSTHAAHRTSALRGILGSGGTDPSFATGSATGSATGFREFRDYERSRDGRVPLLTRTEADQMIPLNGPDRPLKVETRVRTPLGLPSCACSNSGIDPASRARFSEPRMRARTRLGTPGAARSRRSAEPDQGGVWCRHLSRTGHPQRRATPVPRSRRRTERTDGWRGRDA